MKKKDVPQDLKYYKGSVIRDLTYALDDEGHYEAVRSDGWEPKTEALDIFLGTLDDKEERAKMELEVPTAFKGHELKSTTDMQPTVRMAPFLLCSVSMVSTCQSRWYSD